jgi:hypothetical protein
MLLAVVGAIETGFMVLTVKREVWIPSKALVFDCIFNVLFGKLNYRTFNINYFKN